MGIKIRERGKIKITEHKEEFPKFEDIEGFTGPEWFFPFVGFIALKSENQEKCIYDSMKKAYENGVNVTWKLKEKIDRRLHVNKELAQAVGEYLLIAESYPLLNTNNVLVCIGKLDGPYPFYYGTDLYSTAILNDNWHIPQSVIDRMNELKEQNKQD